MILALAKIYLGEGGDASNTRGVNDVLIAVVDGLKGFPER
jgi:hypothetical protein